MTDGQIVDATIAATRLDALPTGTMYVELICECEIDGQAARVPVKIFVTEKSAGRAVGSLRKLGYDIDTQDIAALNAGPETPLAGVALKIALKETKWGVQGELPQTGGMNAASMARMAAMLKGGRSLADGPPGEDAGSEEIPF